MHNVNTNDENFFSKPNIVLYNTKMFEENKENIHKPNSPKNKIQINQHTQIEKLQQELERLRKEAAFKEKCIQSHIDGDKAFEQEVRTNNITLKKLERKFMAQIPQMMEIKEKIRAKKADVLQAQSKIQNTMQNCQRACDELQKHKEKEDGYKQRLENMRTKMQELDQECMKLKRQVSNSVDNAQADLVKQANEKDERTISELTLMLKRWEIKTSSLENELKRKTDECAALSSILDQF